MFLDSDISSNLRCSSMTRFGHKLNYVINTFVKHTPGHCLPFHVYLECDLTNVWHQGFITKRKDTFFMFINIFQYQIIQINCVKVKITAET